MQEIQKTSELDGVDSVDDIDDVDDADDADDVNIINDVDDVDDVDEVDLTNLDETLNAIQRLYDDLAYHMYSLDYHLNILCKLKACGSLMKDEIKNARTTVSSLLILPEEQWLEWIHDALKDPESDDLYMLELYAQAVDDLPTVTLFKEYCEFVIRNFDKTSGESPFDYDKVISVFSLALDRTGYNIALSHEIWDLYIEFLGTRESYESLKKLYRNRLSVPHANLSDTFSRYSTFISSAEQDDYEAEMSAANKIFSQTLKAVNARDRWEISIKTAPSLENFAGYIQWELARPKKFKIPELVSALYERAIQIHSNIAEIWDDYIIYLSANSFSNDRVLWVCSRAVKACPESGALWSHRLRLLEIFNRSHEDIINVRSAIDSIPSFKEPQKYQDWKVVMIAWLGFLFRGRFSDDSFDELLVSDSELSLERAVKDGRSDPYFDLETLIISMYSRIYDSDREKVRTIWKQVSKYRGSNSLFWLKWFHWEQVFGDYHSASDVIHKAVGRNNLDWPDGVFQEFLEFERFYGTAYSTQQAVIICRQRSKALSAKSYEAVATKRLETAEVGEEIPRKKHKSSNDQENDQENSEIRESVKDSTKDVPKDLGNHRDREHNTVIVSELPSDIDEQTVTDLFADCGIINQLSIKDLIATIEFADRQGFLAALTKDRKQLNGKEISVKSGQSTTLWVTNFPSGHSHEQLQKLFEQYGHVVGIRFPSLKYNTHRRFCYVQYANSQDAKEAMESLDGKQLDDSKDPLVVKLSDPSKRQERSGGVYEGRQLFIKGIDFNSVDEEKLRNVFAKFGVIEKIRLPLSINNKANGKLHDGYGFITFKSPEQAHASLELDGTIIGDRTIKLKISDQIATKTTSKMVIDNEKGVEGKTNSTVTPADIGKRTLVLLNLSDTVNDSQLRVLFEPHGRLKQIVLHPDQERALIEFDNEKDAGNAALAMDGYVIAGKRIKVTFSSAAKPKHA